MKALLAFSHLCYLSRFFARLSIFQHRWERKRQTWNPLLLPVIPCPEGSQETVTPDCTKGLKICGPLLSSFSQCTHRSPTGRLWCKQLKKKNTQHKYGQIWKNLHAHFRQDRVPRLCLSYSQRRHVQQWKDLPSQPYFQYNKNTAYCHRSQTEHKIFLFTSMTGGWSSVSCYRRSKHTTWQCFGAGFWCQSSGLNDIHF